MSCGSRNDITDETVLELRGQDCLSQLVTPMWCYSSVVIELELVYFTLSLHTFTVHSDCWHHTCVDVDLTQSRCM